MEGEKGREEERELFLKNPIDLEERLRQEGCCCFAVAPHGILNHKYSILQNDAECLSRLYLLGLVLWPAHVTTPMSNCAFARVHSRVSIHRVYIESIFVHLCFSLTIIIKVNKKGCSLSFLESGLEIYATKQKKNQCNIKRVSNKKRSCQTK